VRPCELLLLLLISSTALDSVIEKAIPTRACEGDDTIDRASSNKLV
jgi:hypothetical protein